MRAGARLAPVSVVAATVLLGALAVAQAPRLSLLPHPRLGGPRIAIAVIASQAGAGELLAGFTQPLERELLALPEVAGVEGRTADGSARLLVRGAWGADPEALRLAVERRLAAVGIGLDSMGVELLPAAERPLLAVAVLGSDAAARTAYARGVLASELARAAGAERIEVTGATPLRVVVRPLAAALMARGLTADDLARRLARVGTTLSVGRARQGATARPLVMGEEVTSLAALRELRLPAAGGEALLRDVATARLVALGDGDAYRFDGVPGVLVSVHAERSANAVVRAWRLRRAMAALAADMPAGLTLRRVDDGGVALAAALLWLAVAALVSGLAAGAVVWRFGRGTRVAAVAAVVPLLASVVAVLLLMVAGVVVDPGALAALAACMGAVSWPVLWREESGETPHPLWIALGALVVTLVPVVSVGSAARGLAGGAVASVAAVVVVAWGIAFAFGSAFPFDAGGRLPAARLESTAWRVALAAVAVALAAVVVVAAWRARAGGATPAREEVVVRFVLAPQLDAGTRARRGAELVEGLLRAMPSRPRHWQWTQEPTRPSADEEEPAASLRLWFDDDGDARHAASASRAWLAGVPAIRARVERRGGGWLAGAESPGAMDVWATAATTPASRALATVASERLRAAVPGVVVDDGAVRGEAWRVAPLPRTAGGRGAARLEADLSSALGDFDVGSVRIPGVEPAIRLLPPEGESARVELLPVHGRGAGVVSGVGSGGTDGGAVRGTAAVVPLAATASVRRVARAAALERRDGRPAVRLSLHRSTAASDATLARALDSTPRRDGERLEAAGPAPELHAARVGLLRAVVAGAALALAVLLMAGGSLPSSLAVALAFPCAWVSCALLGYLTGFLEVGIDGAGLTVALGALLASAFAPLPSLVVCRRAEARRLGGSDPGDAARAARSELVRPLVATLVPVLAVAAVAGVVGDASLARPLAWVVAAGLAGAVGAALGPVPALDAALQRRSRAGALRRGGSGAPGAPMAAMEPE
jgi:MFS family permease